MPSSQPARKSSKLGATACACGTALSCAPWPASDEWLGSATEAGPGAAEVPEALALPACAASGLSSSSNAARSALVSPPSGMLVVFPEVHHEGFVLENVVRRSDHDHAEIAIEQDGVIGE